MNLLDDIEHRLRKSPQLTYERKANSITVEPYDSDGFEVSIQDHGLHNYTICFNGWHEDFDSDEEALNVFAFGLSSDCRLKEYRRGGFPYRWTLEGKEDGIWIEDSTTALIIFPFWMKREIRVLQNTLIKMNSED
jgi:hypothetical protein